MDCFHARLLLQFNGPSPSTTAAAAIAQDETAMLQGHLAECRECRGLAQREKLTDAAFGPAMRNVPLPAGNMQGRILERLRGERGPSPWPWVAGAAVLLIAVGIGAGLYYRPVTPTFDHASFEEKHQSAAKRELVEEWFRKQRVPMKLPKDADLPMAYLDSWDVVNLQGRRVASLLFVKTDDAGHGNAVAHVYVIPKGAFRFDEDFATRARSSSGTTALSTHGDFEFLWIFTRGMRDAFRGAGGFEH